MRTSDVLTQDSMKRIRVIQIGLGPLGIKVAELIAQRQGILTMAAVDNNPKLVGKSLDTLSEKLNKEVLIKESVADAIYIQKPDVAIITTVSDMKRIAPQVEELINLNIPVVSTCEELSYPWEESCDVAKHIDMLARKKGVAVVGTGVNPGFLMDALPSFLTSLSQDVESIHVKRFQNAGIRRVPFQKKIGAGLTPSEFEVERKSGKLRHVGLKESMNFIAASLGWTLDRTVDHISPVIAANEIESEGVEIKAGHATGVHQVGTAYVGSQKKITLTFQAAVGEESSYDEIEIKGSPHIKSRIEGGINGDVATCAITVNTTRQILKAQPGLRTMADIPMTSYFN